MTLTTHKIPIISGRNDISSTNSDQFHPNGSLFCSKYNALIDQLITDLANLEGPAGPQGEQGIQGPAGPQGEQGIQGLPGNDGISVTWRGTWSNSFPYLKDDAVNYQGNSYIANTSNTNKIPGTDLEWDLWIAKGPQGDQGAQGIQGPVGPQGEQGIQGIQGPAGADGLNGVSLNQANNFTKAQTVATVALTDASTIAVDASLSNVFSVTLTNNRTLANPTNLSAGQTIIFKVKQDATGSRTLTFSSAYKFSGGVSPTLTTTPNKLDIISCISDGTNLYCNFVGGF